MRHHDHFARTTRRGLVAAAGSLLSLLMLGHLGEDPPRAAAAANGSAAAADGLAGAEVRDLGPCVRFNSGHLAGSATIIGPRRADGRFGILTAAHCIPEGQALGSITTRDGRTGAVRLDRLERSRDWAWCETIDTALELPYAKLSTAAAVPGSRVWHSGFGFDRPGNVEVGKILSAGPMLGRVRVLLNVSSGDSGAGVFLCDGGELVAVVSSTARTGALAEVTGADPPPCPPPRTTVLGPVPTCPYCAPPPVVRSVCPPPVVLESGRSFGFNFDSWGTRSAPAVVVPARPVVRERFVFKLRARIRG